MKKHRPVRLAILLSALLSLAPRSSLADPVQFESHQTHPLDILGDRLVALNSADNRVSVFDMSTGTPVLEREIRVGLEPVSVRMLNSSVAWVANHLSDDVSVIDLDLGTVLATIPVGDEPADIAFVDDPVVGGLHWAVVTISREDRVVILEAEGARNELFSIDLNGADPRAMAVDPNAGTVWIAVFESGSNTTLVRRDMVADISGPYLGALPPYSPSFSGSLPPANQPDNGLIVKKNGTGQWLDDMGGDWSSFVTWDLYDQDIIRLNISASPNVATAVTGVGTLIEDLVVNPANGDIWVVNIDSFNDVYFEDVLQGDFARNHLTQIPGGSGTPVDHLLNDHVVTSTQATVPGPVGPLADDSLCIPNEVILSDISGATELYVSSLGGERIAVVNPATGLVVRRLACAEGAVGLVAHPGSGNLIMLNWFDNSLELIDPNTGTTGTTVPVGLSGWDPTPPEVKDGRPFLYTGNRSGNGNMACATCHPYGHFDGVAWNLGNTNIAVLDTLPPEENFFRPTMPFHPDKGPLMSQSLRGLLEVGRLHWRGDRADVSAFNGAFGSLMGGIPLTPPELQMFSDFVGTIKYPPNPVRSLDDSMNDTHSGNPNLGETTYTFFACISCHKLPWGTDKVVVDTAPTALGNQSIKNTQARGLLDKEGFDDHFGSNKRGFGFTHDGEFTTLEEFVAEPGFFVPVDQQANLVAFLLNFNSETYPAVGAQVTFDVTSTGDQTKLDILSDLIVAANQSHMDLIAHGTIGAELRGYNFIEVGFHGDRLGDIKTSTQLLSLLVGNATITFLAVPLGEGVRMGNDRDLDGVFDRDEIDLGGDPADPNNTPTLPTATDPFANPANVSRVTSIFPAPFNSTTTVQVYLSGSDRARVDVFDVRGRRVRVLADETLSPGVHSFTWDGRDQSGAVAAAGTYLVKLATTDSEHVRKVAYVK